MYFLRGGRAKVPEHFNFPYAFHHDLGSTNRIDQPNQTAKCKLHSVGKICISSPLGPCCYSSHSSSAGRALGRKSSTPFPLMFSASYPVLLETLDLGVHTISSCS